MEGGVSKRVSNKVALVTGGGGAIGRAICLKLAKEGAKVALSDVDEAAGKETVSLIEKESGTAIFSCVNVSKEKEVSNWVNEVVDKWGGIDILVNNAAAFVFGTVEEVSEEDWDRVLAVNVKGYAFCVKYAAPEMKKRKGGSVVNIASVSGFIAQPSFVPYNTSKGSTPSCVITLLTVKLGAIMQLTRCTAMDLGEYNIRVNGVCPGTIDTPATSKHAAKLGITKAELTQQVVKDHFIKRLGTVEDVANAVLFLASDESSFISGSFITVDGGSTAH